MCQDPRDEDCVLRAKFWNSACTGCCAQIEYEVGGAATEVMPAIPFS